MKIYTTMAPSPARVLALVRLLEQAGGSLPPLRLAQMIDPTDATWSTDRPTVPAEVTQIINAGVELGLVTDHRDHVRLIAGADLTTGALRPDAGNQFAVACAWLLTQPIVGGPGNVSAIQSGLDRCGLLKELALSNPVRINMVLHWARYLGLVGRLRTGSGQGVVPDPTEFLRRHLDALLADGPVLAGEFVQRLGQVCPVLDGGAVRLRVLERMRLAGIEPPGANRWSDALSFALRRLAGEDRLHWVYRNDDKHFVNLSRDERLTRLAAGPAPKRGAR